MAVLNQIIVLQQMLQLKVIKIVAPTLLYVGAIPILWNIFIDKILK